MLGKIRFLMVCLLVLIPLTVNAQENLEEEYYKNIKVFQPKPILLKHRFELTPVGAYSMNPNMLQHVGVGGILAFHIDEQFGVAAQYLQFFTFPTATKDEVKDYFGLFPERSEVGYSTTLRFVWTPFLAKSRFLGMLNYWDAYLFAGGGITQTRLTEFAGTGEFGLGLKFYLSRGLAFIMEFSDLLYVEQFRDESAVMQDFMVRVGISLFLPYSFSYRTEK